MKTPAPTFEPQQARQQLEQIFATQQPYSRAVFGLVTASYCGGTAFRWHNYVTGDSGFICFAIHGADTIRIGAALLDELTRLRSEMPEKGDHVHELLAGQRFDAAH